MWSLNSKSILASDCKQRAAGREGSQNRKFASSNWSPRIKEFAPRGSRWVPRLVCVTVKLELSFSFCVSDLLSWLVWSSCSQKQNSVTPKNWFGLKMKRYTSVSASCTSSCPAGKEERYRDIKSMSMFTCRWRQSDTNQFQLLLLKWWQNV